YAERYLNRGEAMSREWHIKRDRKFRKRLGLDWRN
ncbi:MAG: GIY-YIG nuclease family protein, partial [Rhodospirillaceae bacterium]|nr:GIY-YIG nuclease family protein [Rhodospirillaceae bacterium]